MGNEVGGGAPDDLPRSPSGRVPRWVVDEALGSSTGDTAGRGATASVLDGDVQRGRRRRRSRRKALVGLIAVLAVVGVVAVAVRNPGLVSRLGGSAASTANDWPPAGLEEGTRPRLAWPEPQPAPADGSGVYLATQPGSTLPVTWSPCRPIHYVVRAADETVDGLGLLQSAVAEISRDTGIRFVYDGTTEEAPSDARKLVQPDRYGDRWAPVLIAWVGQRENPEMTSQVLGMTRPDPVPLPGDAATSPRAYVSGQVLMNSDLIGRVQRQLGAKATRTVFLHELGHLMGLDHVGARNAIMFPSYQPRVVTFTTAEMAGLHSLGSGPCRPEV